MLTNLTFDEAIVKLRDGYVVKRIDWTCKQIRGWIDSDADYFMSDVPRGKIIIQVCDAPYTCKIAPYIEESGDKDAKDWVVFYKLAGV